MRLIRQISLLLCLVLIVGGLSRAQAAVLGSGQPFTSLVQSPAGILGVDADGIWLSTDDGATFNKVSPAGSDAYSYFALAASGNTVVAVGETGLVLRSTDGGNNWSEAADPGLFGDLISVATDGDGVWLATGDAFTPHLLQSTDDGQTWNELTAPAATGLRAVAWQADTGWVLAGEGEGSTFAGIIYQSTDDGANWQLLEDELAAPINAIAINSTGQITVVGESGLILQGTTSTAFLPPVGDSVSAELHAVIATSSGSFVVGGDSGTLLTIDGNGAVDTSLGGDPDIEAILSLANDDLLISGDYEAPVPAERTIPFNLLISRDANSGDFVLTVLETLTDRNYRIESSIDLQGWSEVVGSERAGNGAAQVWTYPEDGARLFWRAVEF